MSRSTGGAIEAPPSSQHIVTSNKWTEHEISVMKKIHAAYLRSLEVEEIQRLKESAKTDPEFFLPKNCSMRSDKGELLKPMWGGRGPFDSYDEFILSTQFSHWIPQTQSEINVDDFMNDWAKTIIRDICTEQGKDLRDKGSQVFGSSKREHVVPLSLLLHDLKVWCVQFLRNGKIVERETYLEVGRRIRFLTYIIPRDVWSSGSKLNPLGKGLTKDAHHALSYVLQKVIETLREVYDYSFKRYFQHSCLGKSSLVLSNMQLCVFIAARFISAVSTTDEDIIAAKDKELKPFELVDTSITQSYSDWTVMANVSLRFAFRDRLSRCSLGCKTSNMDPAEKDAVVGQIKTWIMKNPFIYRQRPGEEKAVADITSTSADNTKVTVPGTAPMAYGDVREDPKVPGLAACFQAALDSLQKELAEGSSIFGSAVAKHVRFPITKEKHLINLKKAFPDDAERTKALRCIFKMIGALRDTIPAFYVLAEYTSLLGDDKKICLDTLLRGEFVRILADVCLRFTFILASAKAVAEDMSEIASSTLASQGKMEEAAQLLLKGAGVPRETSKRIAITNKKGSVIGTKASTEQDLPDPHFVKNLDFACGEVLPALENVAKALFKQVNNLASELYFFECRTMRQIETPEERLCVTLADHLVRIRSEDFNGNSFFVARFAPKKDYLNISAQKLRDIMKMVSDECAYQEEPCSLAYINSLNAMDRDLQAALKPAAHEPDYEDEVLEQFDKIEVAPPTITTQKVPPSSTTKPSKPANKTTDLVPRMDIDTDESKSVSEVGKSKSKKRLSLFGRKLF